MHLCDLLELKYGETFTEQKKKIDHYKKILSQWEECFGVPFETAASMSTPRELYTTLKKSEERIAQLEEQIKNERLMHGLHWILMHLHS